MEDISRTEIIGVGISNVNLQSALDYLLSDFDNARSRYICAANVHTTVTAHEDNCYREVQNNSFLTLPDGKPLSVIGKRRGVKEIGRVTGPDFLEAVLERTENTEYKHFFYGTTKENLDAFVATIKLSYPKIKVAGAVPSAFRPLSAKEENELIDSINESKADFVWVALGAPRQEFFCSKLCSRTKAVWIAVGGAFNVISGVIPRAPKWMQDHSLEWLYRLLKEPKRLFKRYLVTNCKFIWYVLLGAGRK